MASTAGALVKVRTSRLPLHAASISSRQPVGAVGLDPAVRGDRQDGGAGHAQALELADIGVAVQLHRDGLAAHALGKEHVHQRGGGFVAADPDVGQPGRADGAAGLGPADEHPGGAEGLQQLLADPERVRGLAPAAHAVGGGGDAEIGPGPDDGRHRRPQLDALCATGEVGVDVPRIDRGDRSLDKLHVLLRHRPPSIRRPRSRGKRGPTSEAADCYRAPRNPSASTSTADRASVAADSFRMTGVGKSETLTSSISRSKAQVASRTALLTAQNDEYVRATRHGAKLTFAHRQCIAEIE